MPRKKTTPKPGQKLGGTRRQWGRLRVLRSGRFQASYPGPDLVVYYAPVTFTTKGDARAWLETEQRLLERDEWSPPATRARERYARGVTLTEYSADWLAGRRNRDGQPLRPRTLTHYRGLLDDHILPELGDGELAKLTPERVAAWFNAMDVDTPTIRAHAYGLLRSICTSATRGSSPIIKGVNPCQIVGGGATRRRASVTIPTLEELAVIVESIPPKYRVMILLAAWCGFRFGEVSELRRKDINLAKGSIHIARGVVQVKGGFIVGPPKTESSKRTVAIPPHLIPAIEDHLKEWADSGPEGLLFVARQGGHIGQSSVQKVLRNASTKAGLPNLRFHELRHTGATLAAATGATLAELMARLGHSTPQAAMRYQHAARDRDQAIAEALSKMVNPGD